MSKTAKQVAAKIVALLVGDYTSRFEIEAVENVAYGQRVRVRDLAQEESYVVTVEKFNDVAPIAATVDQRTATEREADEQAAAKREDDEAEPDF